MTSSDRPRDPVHEVLARGDVTVVRVASVSPRPSGAAELSAALAALDAAEARVGAPLVDESERERLVGTAGAGEAAATLAASWHPLAALRGEQVVGYAALVVSGGEREPAGSRQANGDAAVLDDDPSRVVFGALLGALQVVARQAHAETLQVWVRHAGDPEVALAEREGLQVARRLGVLGRDLDDPPEPVEPLGHRIRAFRPGQDDDGVVGVLAAAYAGTDEAGWDLARFRERQGWSWFRPEDLLVAEADDGHLAGLHWLKRRDATTGEVYNLAVHPHAQGHRLGPALLSAGLRHLAEVGLRDVVLWVDRANERAVALYERHGFATRWDDIAFTSAVAT